MIDLNRKFMINLKRKLVKANLDNSSLLALIFIVLDSYRFSVSFCKFISHLIDKFTPSPSGDEDKKGYYEDKS